jgi:hypothetical protein
MGHCLILLIIPIAKNTNIKYIIVSIVVLQQTMSNMVEIIRLPPGKAKGYEREYDKKGNAIYTPGEINALNKDQMRKELCQVKYDENDKFYL